jgi:serine/arginine repetitive matrix protein 2
MRTFGERSALCPREGSKGSIAISELQLAPRSPAVQSEQRDSLLSVRKAPLAKDAKRMLGMRATLGASDGSAYQDEDFDGSDPDSDVPDELQDILSKSTNGNIVGDHDQVEHDARTLSYRSSLPLSPPPPMPLPTVPSEPIAIGIMDVDDEGCDMERSPSPTTNMPPQIQVPISRTDLVADDGEGHFDGQSPEDDTYASKQSFDFTGELQKLSGDSDRRSFVAQLENAFKTPAKMDLRHTIENGLLSPPPVPTMPAAVKSALDKLEGNVSRRTESSSSVEMQSYSAERIVDGKELTMGPDASTWAGRSEEPTASTNETSDYCKPLP